MDRAIRVTDHQKFGHFGRKPAGDDLDGRASTVLADTKWV